MSANNPYSIEIESRPESQPPPVVWPFIAWAALGPVAIIACYMFTPYMVPSLHNTWLFLQGKTVLYSSLVIGYFPIAAVAFRTKVDTRFAILFACPFYFLVGYWVLFFFAVSVAGLLFNEYL
jgi:hypothetical protein